MLRASSLCLCSRLPCAKFLRSARLHRDQKERVIDVTRRFPESHGDPVHVGDPAAIGIEDLADNIENIGLNDVRDDEVPVFWACGVTAMEAVRAAAPDLFITHAPAHMLITDRPAVGRHD